MPLHFEGFGVRFLYPENWKLAEQIEASGTSAAGATLENDKGMFFSVNRYPGVTNPKEVVDKAIAAMRDEYDPLEVEPCGALARDPDAAGLAHPLIEEGADLSFYVMDLLITGRLLAIVHEGDTLLVQIQGESRDFDQLEPVFAAMLKSLRDSLTASGAENRIDSEP